MRENQGHVVAKGGIEVLVAAMHGHPQDVQTQRNGGGALSNLSTQSCEGGHPVAIEKLEESCMFGTRIASAVVVFEAGTPSNNWPSHGRHQI